MPFVFMNVQTEVLLTKISGETALSTVNMASLSDLAGMANASLYGFKDYHGVDIVTSAWCGPCGRHAASAGAAPRGAQGVQAAGAVQRRRR